MNKLRVICCVLFFAFTGKLSATHNRAGEITYEHVSGFTYKIRVTTYTKTSSIDADRCELTVDFGDGTNAIFQRINGAPISGCNRGGEPFPDANDVKKNIYEGEHTYAGAGTYIITMEDPNRNAGVCNIPNSVNQPFYLLTVLNINPFFGGVNNSPVLLNPPIDEACVGECFEHNPSAYDVDGDSLSYTLVSSYADGQPVSGFTFPPNMNASSIDPLKGDLIWCSPTTVCEYNLAILIKEYRRLPGSAERFEVGSVLRDMQINVRLCANDPPVIKHINDTCIAAGTNLTIPVQAKDPNGNQTVKLTATGGPFVVSPAATFTAGVPANTTNGVFSWNPSCAQVQLLPYSVSFKAEDNSINTLADYKTIFITVVAHAPANLTGVPSGASIVLNWNQVLCNNTLGDNPLVNYIIYRKNTCDNWIPGACETGIPSYVGYTQIATIVPGVTTFTDNNNGQGLTDGIEYSYRIVATYTDGSSSYASTNVCVKLLRDVPIITNVSVLSTGVNDSIWVHWVPPVGDTDNLDTLVNPPPYESRLMQATGFNPSSSAFTQIASYTYNAFWQITDTGYVSKGPNTRDFPYTYRIDFYSNGNLVGSTNTASSIYLSTAPVAKGKELLLSWEKIVPWENYRYYVYKEIPTGSSVFTLLDSTSTTSYVDTGLINGATYCYKIISAGQFSDTTIKRPLINYSQIQCGIPVDTEPPCQPDITSITSDCENAQATITWLNPNNYCSNDAARYRIYFAPTINDSLFVIDAINSLEITTYTFNYLYDGYIPSAAGCYAVVAVDSSGNESVRINKECTDNCPIYDLPNLFTPNNDKINDFFKPLLPCRYIRDIAMKIFNRWGEKVFETTNPEIMWDGKNIANKKTCPDGVYYYVCTVNEIRVSGIVSRYLKGFIHLINSTQ